MANLNTSTSHRQTNITPKCQVMENVCIGGGNAVAVLELGLLVSAAVSLTTPTKSFHKLTMVSIKNSVDTSEQSNQDFTI